MDSEGSFAGRVFLPELAVVSKASEDFANGSSLVRRNPQLSASVFLSRADGEVACTMTSESTLLLF